MRWALVKVALAVTSMVTLAFLIPLAVVVDRIADERALNAAQSRISAIEPLLALTTDHTPLERALATLPGPQNVAVLLPDGTVVGVDHATTTQLIAADANGAAVTLGVPGGSEVLQPELVGGGQHTLIAVYVDAAESRRGVLNAWLILGGVALTLIAGSILLADQLGARLVKATRHLADASRQLGEGDVGVRITTQGPYELLEVGQAFNTMADRIVHLLATERELVADLSHRLRTPLTALRLNAAALDETPAADATRDAITKLEQEVDAIIRSARQGASQGGSCDLATVVTERMAFWSALAEDQERPWQLNGASGPAPVGVPAPELAAALDAVLGNVFRHTPEGTAFQVTVHTAAETSTVLVDDSGPGLAEPDTALQRGAGSGGIGSTGLGLDIVKKLAERAGGRLAIDASPLGGAQVHFSLPLLTSIRRTSFPADRRSHRQLFGTRRVQHAQAGSRRH
ncbi:MAG TPA: HAMP domain-containing sensor histidine kinase [Actinocrinis sp.]|nr:HAMP domain-containing sensor histidine kinase [Actinocrinis sp.]